MKLLQKWLLALAVAGLVAGIILTLIRARFPVALTVILPLGACFYGLFLITFIFRSEIEKFNAEERAKIEAAKRYQGPESQKTNSVRDRSGNAPESKPKGSAENLKFLPSKHPA